VGEGTTTVLVADDEDDMRMLVRLILDLSDAGLTIVGEAADGAEAVKLWRDLDGASTPDVIVLDNRMPVLTGLEAAAEILGERPSQRIVLYSAYLDDEVRRQATEVGIAACVTKEELKQLPQVIATVLT
jgi:NarL family two-component system response regulator LiaR